MNQVTEQDYDHLHDCALYGESFPCNQSLCHASLSRYCDDCKADLFHAA